MAKYIDWLELIDRCEHDAYRAKGEGAVYKPRSFVRCAKTLRFMRLRIRRTLAEAAAMRWQCQMWVGDHDENGVDPDGVVAGILSAADQARKEIR